MFIKLTDHTTGESKWLNVYKMRKIQASVEWTEIEMSTLVFELVNETPEEIVKMIGEMKK